MGEFRFEVDATLNMSKIKSQLDSLKGKKIDVDLTVANTDKLEKLRSDLKSIKNTNVKVNVNSDGGKLKQISSELKAVKGKNIKVGVDSSGVKQAQADFTKLNTLLTEINQKRVRVEGLDTAKDKSQIDALKTSINSLEKEYDELYAKTNKSLSDSQLDKLGASAKKAERNISETKARVQDLENSAKSVGKAFTSLDASMGSNKVETYLKTNTKLSKELKASFEGVGQAYKTAMANNDFSKIGDINKEFALLKSTASARGETGMSFFSNLKRGASQIFQFVGVYGIFQRAAQAAGDMARQVLAVDTAMTGLRKVSSASDNQITAYFDKAVISAKKYGSAVSDVINSTADWSRLGYGLKDAEELSDKTTLYQKVGDNMTQETASSSLISTLKGFQFDASEAGHIIDSFNEVGNKFAIGSDGIGESLRRSSASMAAAGNTMEQTIGLVTAANTVVQDPEVVGTAYKTISMRIRGATTELENAGLETDGMVESTTKLQEEMLALSGIDIMQDKDTFKSTYDILDELAYKWKDLTDIQQASVTELIAGMGIYLYVQKCA